uniref:Uncharacterized protein n=1 Tax=Tanacetum cinerariifolium TaxID=118510 RepID=A0A6L2MA04_TANCI|nr:hypothetical protein [Tanacetum cinerariifolium]
MIDILIGLEEVHPLGAEERVFVDRLKEGLSETLAGEEFPINDVLGVNATPRKSIVAYLVHTTLEYPEHSNLFLNLYSLGGRGLTSIASSSLAHGLY